MNVVTPTRPERVKSGGQVAAAAASETSVIDANLAAHDFCERLRLVQLPGEGKLWPALEYDSVGQLQEAVEADVKDHTSESDLQRIHKKICMGGLNINGGCVFLLGRGKLKRAIVPLCDDQKILKFYSRIDRIRVKDEYRNDDGFQRAYRIAMERTAALNSDDDDDSIETVQAKLNFDGDEEKAEEEEEEGSSTDASAPSTHEPTPKKQSGKKRKARGSKGKTGKMKRVGTTDFALGSSVLTNAQKTLIENKMEGDFLGKFEDYLTSVDTVSESNRRSIMRQVTKLAEGKGIDYKSQWPEGCSFLEGTKVGPTDDILKLREEGVACEKRWGEDRGHGWLLKHPLKKLYEFQQYHLNKKLG